MGKTSEADRTDPERDWRYKGMTREQKIEWLANASVEDLLKQYEVSARNADNPWETVNRDSRYTLEGIFED